MSDISSHELEAPFPPGDEALRKTHLSAAKAALDACIGRWVSELSRQHNLDHPDFGTPEQLAQDARVDRTIRAMFWNLTPEQTTDPDTLERTRAAVGNLISHELGLDRRTTIRATPEETALRRQTPDGSPEVT